MKTLRFLHTADWHLDGDNKKMLKAKISLNQIIEYCTNNKVNAIIHSGDIWERKQSYSQKSGVPFGVEYLRVMAKHVDFIFITKGNNSHDEAGSVSLLHQLEPNIYAYEYPVVLAVEDNGNVYDLLREMEPLTNPQYITSLVPYPTKASFISENSIDNNNADFIEKFEGVFDLISEVTQPYTCPKLLAFHGNVVGSRLSTGQTLVSQDIMVAPKTLQKAKHDYYALGHIHLRQEVAPNMVYSGSIYNKNWGETEQKSFEVIEFDNWTDCEGELEGRMKTEQVKLNSARPMVTVEASFCPDIQNPDFVFDEDFNDEKYANAEVRFRCAVKENDRKLITEEKIQAIKKTFGDDVKIEWNVIPDDRESRSEAIMNAKTLLEEVEEYAKVIEYELPDSVKEKVLSLQESTEVPV